MDFFYDGVTERLNDELDKRALKQAELIALCQSAGMPVNQSSISKILSGKAKPNLYQLAAISKALNISLDFFIWGKDICCEDFCNSHGSEKLCVSGQELEYYQGLFHFYYLSTASNEDKVLHGRLNIVEDGGFYALNMELDTGETRFKGEPIIKEYKGRVLVSSALALGAVYLIFKSEYIGEICMICLRHRSYTVKNAECRVGLALTMGAGDVKDPTVHRCLLARDDLDTSFLEELRPWLGMIGNDISIEKDKFEKIIKEMVIKYPKTKAEFERTSKYAVSKEVVALSVDELKKRLSLEKNEFVDFLTMLYWEADAIPNYKISQTDDMQFFEKLTAVRAQKNNTTEK